MPSFAGSLPQLTPRTMGTGGVTDPSNPEHVRIARLAMEAGVWFHVSDYGGGVYAVLKQAFAEDPAHVPPCIVKVDGVSVQGFHASVEDCLRRTGLERIAIGQVCGYPLCEEPEALAEALAAMKARGVIGSYIMDVIYPYSAAVLQADAAGLFDGYIFYLNVMERELSNAAYAQLVAGGTPILAMRTFGGRDGANYLKNADHPRRAALEPLYQRSGCADRLEFCVRFPLSLPNVRTTIGSTGSLANLQAFLSASTAPLDADIAAGVEALHSQWNAGR
jgi:aryl-alcohol dehydrogenase-like predicted oxidoreductase